MRRAAALLAAVLLLPSGAGRGQWELTVRPEAFGAVFEPGEAARFTVTVRSADATTEGAEVRWHAETWAGGALGAERTAELPVPQGEARSLEITLNEPDALPQQECLRLVVSLWAVETGRNARPTRRYAQWRKGFGFLPRRAPGEPPESSPFGLLGDYGWPLMQRLGVRYVRPNWSWTERPMEWAQRYSIAYCPLINEANAAARGQVSFDEYAEFVTDSVRRYQRYVKYWQLGNEFDIFHRDGPAKYVAVQKAGYEAAKRADPDCVVVGGSITELQVRREGFREALDLGLADYCDVYDFHFYQPLAVSDELLDWIHATLAETGAEKPIWVTETTQVGMFDSDDENQASYVYKRYAHLLSRGVSVVMWHALTWPYPFSADKVAATALIDHDGFARPSLFAYAALTRELSGTRFARRWPLGAETYVLQFSGEQKHVLVAWQEGDTQDVVINAPVTEGLVTDLTGHGTVVETAGNGLSLPLSDRAVLIRLGAEPSEVRQRAASLPA